LEYIPETNNIYNVLSEEFETPTTDLKIWIYYWEMSRAGISNFWFLHGEKKPWK
jgi:hypothetical protein